jgi:uncharacterized membrane protein YidH (DUF202 family)
VSCLVLLRRLEMAVAWSPAQIPSILTNVALKKFAMELTSVGRHGRTVKRDKYARIATVLVPVGQRATGCALICALLGFQDRIAICKITPGSTQINAVLKFAVLVTLLNAASIVSVKLMM